MLEKVETQEQTHSLNHHQVQYQAESARLAKMRINLVNMDMVKAEFRHIRMSKTY